MSDSSGSIKRPIPWWTVFERISKVLTILIIPVLLWAIRVEIFMRRGPRYTVADANVQELVIQKYVQDQLARLPPAAFREKVDDIRDLAKQNNSEIIKLQLSMARVERDMSSVLKILDNG